MYFISAAVILLAYLALINYQYVLLCHVFMMCIAKGFEILVLPCRRISSGELVGKF